ncbi:DUF859 family phage minor structural protein, partial [Senegalia massiliensis]
LYRPRQVYSSASKSYNIKINGTTVKSGSTTIGGSGTKTIASGTTKVYHNSNGTKKNVAISFYQEVSITWSGVATGNASKSGTMDLTTIPRYAKITSFSISNITGIQFKFNYSVDRSIDLVQYSLNGGSWKSQPSGNLITGLNPGTTYTLRIRVRSSTSGLYTYSNTLTVVTVVLSSISSSVKFNLESNLGVTISRKNSNIVHDIYLEAYYDGAWRDVVKNRLTNISTSATIIPTLGAVELLQNKHPNTKNVTIRVRIVCRWGENGTIQGMVYKSGAATIVNANPSISGITYKDTDTDVQAILNNNQLILRNKSNLQVTAGKATSQKGATLKQYKISIGGNEYSVNTSGTSEIEKTINVGAVNQSSNQTVVLTVIDSRGNKATKSFTVQILNYEEPQFLQVSADRLNNYEESSYANIEARRAVVKPSTIDVNEIYLRYRIKENSIGTYGDYVNIASESGYVSGIWQNLTVNQYMADYPNDKSYTIEVGIKDKFSDWDTILVNLREGIALLSFFKDKIKTGVPFENLAIGKSHEGKATLEVGGHAIIEGALSLGDGFAGNTLALRGLGTGSSNINYISFFEDNGSNRQAYLGFGSANHSAFQIANETGGGISLLGDVSTNGDFTSGNTVVHRGFVPNDWSSIKLSGIWTCSNGSYTNVPSGSSKYGILLTLSRYSGASNYVSYFYTDSYGRIFTCMKWNGVMSEWKMLG